MSDSRSVDALRRRAERALDEGREGRVLEPLLERILRVAPEKDPNRLFAHRHLAELRLERDPWGAALHLRKVISAEPNDDVSHSLMALAQALLGNYRVAVASYRRALALAPRNPWYHHNLGHLLDVALDRPEAALIHLETALEYADPPEHEIVASAAHCMARVGRMRQAQELAEQALEAAPSNREHRALLAWIEDGAQPLTAHRDNMGASGISGAMSGRPGEASPPPATESDETAFETGISLAVLRDLRSGLADEDGLRGSRVDELCAQASGMWREYRGMQQPDVRKPELCAAALHYALVYVGAAPRRSQRELGERYGVPARSVSGRFNKIREALRLTDKR